MKTSELAGDVVANKLEIPKGLLEGYYIEHNGDCWQSVFPAAESALSQLHISINDALAYFKEVKPEITPEILK